MKKGNVTSDTIVGLFVLVAFVLLQLVTFIIRSDLFGGTLKLQATFESTSGLEIGAPVLISGVRAGRVSQIAYRPTPALRVMGENRVEQPVIVTMVVNNDFPVYSNARFRLVQQGFLGDKRVEIDPGSAENGAYLIDDRHPPLAGEPVFDMEKIVAQADIIVADMQATVSSFREIMTDDQNVQAIRRTLDNLTKSMDKVYEYLERNEEDVAAAVANAREVSANLAEITARMKDFTVEGGRFDQMTAETQEAVTALRADLERVARTSEETITAIRESLAGFEDRSERLTVSAVDFLDSGRENFAQLSATLDETSANLNELIVRLRAGEGTVGRLLVDPQPFEDLKASVEGLRNFLVGPRGRFYDSRVEYQFAPVMDPASGRD
jgi:phospholipid/cholesterol/gamma-HCH transport system substrate-binding protein